MNRIRILLPVSIALPGVLLVACTRPIPTTPQPTSTVVTPPSNADVTPPPSLNVVDFSTLARRESHDMPAAIASTTPATVVFRVDGAPVVEGELVTLTGILENTADTPVTLTYFAAGALGFSLSPAPGVATPKPPPPGMPRMPPPAPPPPMLVDVPAHTAVRVPATLALNMFDWTPGAARELEWSLHLWNEPRPHGRVTVP
jgi:hypothetical protein